MFDIVTIGGASRDVFFITSKGRIIKDPHASLKRLIAFESGQKIIPETTEFTYGGGGSNAAISFARLGLKVSAMLSIGAEGTGSLLVNQLEAAGVNTSHILRSREHHTALSVIVGVPGKDHSAFLYRGANNHLAIHDWRSIKTKWFYVSSLTGGSTDLIPELFAYSSAHNICIAWNPGSQQLEMGFHDLARYLEITDILILNRNEAEKLALSKNNRAKVHDVKQIIESLALSTKGIITITDANNGSYCFDRTKIFFQPAIKSEVVETTGAGDSYGSTFVACRFLGCSIEYSMKMAAYNAANVIKNIGAQKGLMNFDALCARIESEDD